MKPLRWIGKRLQARVEAMPSFRAMQEREDRLGPVRGAVRQVAEKPIDDASAKAELDARLAGLDEEVMELPKEQPSPGRGIP